MVASDIILGKHDDELDAILSAVRTRRDALAQAVGVSIKSGDTVRFNDTIRPRYLAGQTAKVSKVNRTTLTVTLTNPTVGRKFGTGPFRCPLTLIAGKVEA